MPELTRAQEKALPATLKRSPARAQRTFAHTLGSAQRSYDCETDNASRAELADAIEAANARETARSR